MIFKRLLIDGSYSADQVYNSDDSVKAAGEMVLGYCSAVIGICATSGGIVLWSIGAAKANNYKYKLQSVSF